MKKAIIIIGEPQSGKTTIAKDMTCFIDSKNILFIDGSEIEHNPFIFNEAHPYTEAIIIDEIDVFEPDLFYNYIPGDILIDKKGQCPFTIQPLLIFIANKLKDDVDLTLPSFTRRFDILNTNGMGKEQLIKFWDNHKPKQSELSNHIIK